MAVEKKLDFEFLRETLGRKYFLVKKGESEFFVFRTPPTEEKSKDNYELLEWIGEIVPWGLVPAKVRAWIRRRGIKPHPKDQKSLEQHS